MTNLKNFGKCEESIKDTVFQILQRFAPPFSDAVEKKPEEGFNTPHPFLGRGLNELSAVKFWFYLPKNLAYEDPCPGAKGGSMKRNYLQINAIIQKV